MKTVARKPVTDTASEIIAMPAPWYPDSGDGTYRNPVLFADYSDPDAIRVGEDYWLTSSSFSHVPGLPILHSRDLVNWSLVNHALPRLVPDEHFSQPRHGEGVWAPSIRFHDGTFWIFYPDPDFGIYVVTAKDPRGRWSEPVLVKSGKGLIDPCPFWDDDRTGYLVHGWAQSRAGISNRLTLHRLADGNRSVIDAGHVVIDGSALSGWHTIEGPKLYRRAGFYYIFAPAGGVTDGYQAVFRARLIDGPYEARIVLARGSTPVNGPHQGAWVDTPEGTDWFLHFQEMPAYGRVVHLQPMQWRDDGWPAIGDDSDRDGTGEPVHGHAKPRTTSGRVSTPASSDEFNLPELGLQWQWQANPTPDFHSLTALPGHLRLECRSQPSGASLWNAPHLLLQKFAAPSFVATTRLVFSPANESERAGLIVFGLDYTWVGLRRDAEGLRLVFVRCLAADEGGVEQEIFCQPFSGISIEMRVTVQGGAKCTFAWSVDGVHFVELPGTFHARSSVWVGAKVGLFASATRTVALTQRGHADFDWFRMGAP
jgi:beta-xylosidase